MASVNDASNVRGEAQRQHELLATADIDDRDREAIENFVRHRRVHGSGSGEYSATTERDDLNKLRLAAERADTPLVEMGMDDLNALLAKLTAPKADGGYGITSGVDGYTRALRVFFRWLDGHDEHPAFGWWEQVKTGNVDFPEPSDRSFPTQANIEAMKRAAGRRGTLRDVAMLSFFADTAVRRTLGAQLRVGDVDLDGEQLANAPAAFRPNPEGVAQKGVGQKWYPIFDAAADLRVWLNRHHPDPENHEAPLWTHPQYDPDDPEGSAISGRHVNRLFKKFGEAAGLDPEAVELKCHSFRHAAVGRWKERGYSLAQVQRRTAWKDKAAAEMWARYGDPDDDALDAGIAEREGIEPDEAEAGDEGTAPPERWTCGICATPDISSPHCPQCGAGRGSTQTLTVGEDNPLRLSTDDEGNMVVEFPGLGVRAPAVVTEQPDGD